MRVILLGFTIPDLVAYKLFEIDPLPAIQTHKFGWSLARALKFGFEKITLVSACPVQNYPIVQKLLFRGGVFRSQGVNGVLLGFLNVIILKHLTRLIACFFTVIPLIKKQRTDWIFLHGVHTPYLLFGLIVRAVGCRMAVVLTDPPGVVLPKDGLVVSFLKRLDSFFIKILVMRADAVISLAPDLAVSLAPQCPALIFPGILDSGIAQIKNSINDRGEYFVDDRPFLIIYAGGLSSAYGVDRLLEAVVGLESNIKVRLELYGRGDQEESILLASKIDPRIVYGGFVDNKVLLPKLHGADLLINPRPTNNSFSELSFPSKLIEYLATGVPVLTTRIKSIPDSLKEHYYYIDEESAAGIRSAIVDIINIPISDRVARGSAGKNFVTKNYSEEVIGKKIFDFINKLKK